MRLLTGIQPSGDLHIGNYFGSIKQMVDAQNDSETFAFIANYHAMTSVNDGQRLAELTMQSATDFLALGIDEQKSTFWVQSDVKEEFKKFQLEITTVNVNVSTAKKGASVEFDIHIAHATPVVIGQTDESLDAAIDLAIDRASKALRRLHDKVVSKQATSIRDLEAIED